MNAKVYSVAADASTINGTWWEWCNGAWTSGAEVSLSASTMARADSVSSFATQALLTHDGNLIITVQTQLHNNLQYRLFIPIVNSADERPYVTAHLSANIHSGGAYDSPILAVAVSEGDSAADVLGVLHGGRPLLVVVPSFVVLEIRQSRPFLYTPNTITITLKTNIDVAANSRLILEGLRGTAHAAGNKLDVIITTPAGTLETTTGPLVTGQVGLTAHIDVLNTLPAQISITVQIRVVNGNQEQGGGSSAGFPAPILRAGLSPMIPMSTGDMLPYCPTCHALLGVDAGLQPLVMIEGKFTSAVIFQTSPLSSSSNTFTLSLQTNVAIRGSDDSLLIFEGVPIHIHTPLAQLAWTPLASMTQKLTLDKVTNSGGLLSFRISSTTGVLEARTPYVLNLTFVNPNAASLPAQMTIRAEGTVVIARAVMQVRQSPAAYGIQNGSLPGYVLRTAFTSVTISQTNPIARAPNRIQLNIKTNAPLTSDSTLTIHGLAPCEGASLSVYSGNEYFYSESAPQWQTSGGKRVIVLTVWKAAGRSEIAFELLFTNPASARSYDIMNPPQISGRIEVGASDSPLSIFTAEVFRQRAFGVLNGTLPLLVVIPAFDVLQMEQTSCLTSSSNELLLRFRLNVNVPGDSFLTLHGLSGMTAADPMFPLMRLDVTSQVIQQEPAYLIRSAGQCPSTGVCISFESNMAVMKTLLDIQSTALVVLGLSVRNGPMEQLEPPAVTVSVSIELGAVDVSVGPTSVQHPITRNLLGVPNGRLVIYLMFGALDLSAPVYAFRKQICSVIFALVVFTVYVAGTGHDAPNGHRIQHVSRTMFFFQSLQRIRFVNVPGMLPRT
jgi:hypothetical protein